MSFDVKSDFLFLDISAIYVIIIMDYYLSEIIMILSLENVSKIYNGNTVLDNIALTIEDHDRIGLVGINGCGKSTLLNIITGKEEPETQPEPNVAKVAVTKSASIGFLAQNTGLDRSSTIIEEMTSVFSELLKTADELRRLEEEMGSPKAHENPEHFKEISEEYAEESWKNYQIHTHALKSTSLNIGAEKLSEHAKALELAAKNADYSYIREHHAEVMVEYEALLLELQNGL